MCCAIGDHVPRILRPRRKSQGADETLMTLPEAQRFRGRNRPFFAPDTASQGVVTGKQIEEPPRSRVGEVLELVPGLIATQHSGEGKANQYFLRGFNLDHGPISTSRSRTCRSTCAPMGMVRAMPTQFLSPS